MYQNLAIKKILVVFRCRRGRVHNDWADKHKSFVDMWETKEQHVIKEERPYDHAIYMDYLRWYRRSTRIRLCTPRISNGHEDGTSGPNATADTVDSLRASRLRYTPRAHLIHSVVRHPTRKMWFCS
jgi:hypothetical protein